MNVVLVNTFIFRILVLPNKHMVTELYDLSDTDFALDFEKMG